MRPKKPVPPSSTQVAQESQEPEPRTPSPYDPNRTYSVNRIVDHRTNKKTKRVLYRVNWVGYTATEDTWEPAENILDKSLLEKYRATCEKRSKQKRKATLSRNTAPRAKRAKGPSRSRSHVTSVHEDSVSNQELVNNNSAPLTSSPIEDNEPTEGQFDIIDDDEVREDERPNEEEWRQVVNVLESDHPHVNDLQETGSVSSVAKPKKTKIMKCSKTNNQLPSSIAVNSEQEYTGDEEVEVTDDDDDEPDLAFYGRPNDNLSDDTKYTLAEKKDPNATVKIQAPAEAAVVTNNDASPAGPSDSNTTQSPEHDSQTSDSDQFHNDVTVTSVTSHCISVNIYEI